MIKKEGKVKTEETKGSFWFKFFFCLFIYKFCSRDNTPVEKNGLATSNTLLNITKYYFLTEEEIHLENSNPF